MFLLNSAGGDWYEQFAFDIYCVCLTITCLPQLFGTAPADWWLIMKGNGYWNHTSCNGTDSIQDEMLWL